MKKPIIAFLASILIGGIIQADDPTPDPDPQTPVVVSPHLAKGTVVLTLKECLHRIMSQDPAIRAIRFNMEALDRRARAVRASYLPQLIATGQVGYVSGQSTSYFSVLGAFDPDAPHRSISGVDAYRSGGGQLTMPLINSGSFFGFNTPPAATAKEKEKEAAGYGYELTTQQIIYSVTSTYLSIIASKNKLDLLGEQRIISRRQLNMTKGQLQYGLDTQADVDAAEHVAEQNDVAYEAASGLAVESFLQLSLMLGIDDPGSFAVQTEYPPMPKLPSYPMLMAMIQDHQPSVLEQEALLGQSKAQLAYDQNRIWPTVNFQGNYAYADGFASTNANLWTAFVTVNVPIFDFGVLHHTARADLAAVEAGALNVQQAKSDLLQNLYAAYAAIRDNTYAAATANSQVATAKKSWDKTQVLEKTDAITLGQALSNEQLYVEARIQQEDTTVRDILAYAQLQSVLGGKWSWMSDDNAAPAMVGSNKPGVTAATPPQ